MATTRIIPMRRSKGKSVLASLKARINYAKNPDKTNDGELVATHECDPFFADVQFLWSKRRYKEVTGREQERDVIAYQVRQSFRPGEITPEEANRIGVEFARRFTKGNHAFIVVTHVDKKHIHNHIIWNSTSLDCTRKWRNFWGSTKAVRQLSDTLCVENGLSIVENPGHKGASYGKWLGENKKPSHREQLRVAVDAAMREKPRSISAMLILLEAAGYEVKPGKNPALRGKNQKRFIRMDTLGEGYTVQELQSVLGGDRAHKPRNRGGKSTPHHPVQLLVDIQAALSAGKGIGYERWAKVFNLKQMAQTLNYLTEHSLMDYELLCEKTDAIVARFDALTQQIRGKERQLSENASLQKHIIQYSKTRGVYVAYRKSGYSKAFLAAHESDILLHKSAKKAFDDLGLAKLPTVARLRKEYADALADKKKLYAQYREVKAERTALLTTKANIDALLGSSGKPKREVKRNRQR